MAGTIEMDNELELVRRGYDPAQVKALVGQLSAELKAATSEADRLRARIAELEQQPPISAVPTPSDDILGRWGDETAQLLDTARASIAKVMEQARADAAAKVAVAESQAHEIRHQAQVDAELVLSQARKQAEETTAGAEAHRVETESAAQATLDETRRKIDEASAQLADLTAQRASISQQLGATKAQLTQLLSIVETPAAPAAENDDEQS